MMLVNLHCNVIVRRISACGRIRVWRGGVAKDYSLESPTPALTLIREPSRYLLPLLRGMGLNQLMGLVTWGKHMIGYGSYMKFPTFLIFCEGN